VTLKLICSLPPKSHKHLMDQLAYTVSDIGHASMSLTLPDDSWRAWGTIYWHKVYL